MGKRVARTYCRVTPTSWAPRRWLSVCWLLNRAVYLAVGKQVSNKVQRAIIFMLQLRATAHTHTRGERSGSLKVVWKFKK